MAPVSGWSATRTEVEESKTGHPILRASRHSTSATRLGFTSRLHVPNLDRADSRKRQHLVCALSHDTIPIVAHPDVVLHRLMTSLNGPGQEFEGYVGKL